VNFAARLDEAIASSGSLLCVGLDPDIADLPDAAAAERWCAATLEATLEFACAVKPNVAFFEQYGAAGWAVLERLRALVPANRLLIVDAKCSDVGHTAQAYARALFDGLGADAVTVNPLLGEDSVRPFLDRFGRGALLLTRTSNSGAADLLEQPLGDGTPLFEHIAALAMQWDPGGSAGLVVGATAPDAVAAVRRRAPLLPMLLPGVGAQGGALEEATAAGLDARGAGLMVSISRAIALAPEGPAAAARAFRRRLDAIRVATLQTPAS